MAPGETSLTLDASSSSAEIDAAESSEGLVRSKRDIENISSMVCGEISPPLAAQVPSMFDSAAEIDAWQKCEAVVQSKYLEVMCKSSGKIRHFASGTEAGFALHLINSTLAVGVPQALHIVATKEEEDPIYFSPKATLVNCGPGWKLQTVIEEESITQMQPIPKPLLSIPYIQVLCKSSGKIRKFASGTEAGFALYLINRKLPAGVPPPLYIEAAKEGEEPIHFGLKAPLVNYGWGWKLQTVIEEGHKKPSQMQQIPSIPKLPLGAVKPEKHISMQKTAVGSSSNPSFQYFIKILTAFALMFLLGGSLAFFLENLPWLMQLVSFS